jgi:type II secretory pathway predicted ATPase ExeA
MLVRNLFGELDQSNFVASQLVTTQVDADDMLRIVAASFGMAHEGQTKASLLNNLERFFKERKAEGKRVLLVVDEAQNLPARSLEELRMLSNFENDGTPLLQSFLLGQEELKRTLKRREMEQFRQRIIAAFHLRPLDRDETQRYIEHRMQRVGWTGDPGILPEAYDQIFAFSEGTPRKINTLCDRLLLFGYLEGLHSIDGQAVTSVLDELKDELWVGVSSDEEDSGLVDEAAPPDSATGLKARVDVLEREVRTLKRILAYDHRLLREAMSQLKGNGKDPDGR